MRAIRALAVVLLLMLAGCRFARHTPTLAPAIPAFPGAQGGGAASVGGRGGAVIEVTNLNDSESGSLRACVQASGPRTCIFRVGGTINLLSRLYTENPYLTVAGQTAPGGGIQISGKNMAANIAVIRAHDIIWRYTRMRKGYHPTCGEPPNTECGLIINFGLDAYDVMFDHNSVQWNEDEGVAAAGASRNVTFSYNLVAEGFKSHSTGWGTGAVTNQTDVDFHHNLTMNNSHRNPILGGVSTRLVNNITYNTRLRLIQSDPNKGPGPQRVDIIGNFFKKGPLNTTGGFNPYEITGVNRGGTQVPSLYLSLNEGYTQPNPTGAQWIMVREDAGQNGPDAGPAPISWKRTTPLANTTFPILAEPVANIKGATGSIIPIVGASRRLDCDGNWVANRDSVDLRLINQYNTNTGITSLFTDESAVGGFPVIASGTPCPDADHDGMPDQWETSKGLNPNDPADRNTVAPANSGYTNLEVYLAGTGATLPAPPPGPPPPVDPYGELTITPACFANADLNAFALAEHPSTDSSQPSLSFLDLLKKNLAAIFFFWR